jgi:glycosyltransferase involved in cell wall biosynthesis
VKLGVVTTSYPRFAGDAAGSFVAGHVAALRALGHSVDVIAAGASDVADPPGVVRVGGAGLFYAGGAPDALERAPIRAGASAIAFTARLAAAVTPRARGWDAILAHWLVPSAIAALPSRKPVLAIAHGGDVHTLRRLRLLAPALHLLHRRDARLVFVSAPLRAIAQAAAPALAAWLDRAAIQPMGIDLARFAALDRAPTDPPIVLVAARLVPIKGVDVAIAAMPHVAHPAHLVIAGDGPERARLIRSAPRDARVRMLGQVTTERRDDLLRTASVVVIPSRVLPSGRTEGTPTIALEALAAGVPVIASAVGGLCELPAVHLVPPGDPRALAAAIDHVLAHPPAPDALRKSVASLDWREVAPRLIRE